VRICDKCVCSDQICLTTQKQVMTSNDEIVACINYKLNPAYALERDLTQALQELVRLGRIRKGWTTRSGRSIIACTEPPIDDEEFIALMKHGSEIRKKKHD